MLYNLEKIPTVPLKRITCGWTTYLKAGLVFGATVGAFAVAKTISILPRISGIFSDSNTQQAALTVTAMSKVGYEDTAINFTIIDFANHFSDENGGNLTKIQIISCPPHGDLQLSDMLVSSGQEILEDKLGRLAFMPNANWNGQTSFAWKGYDGFSYSTNVAPVNITVIAVNDPPVVTSFSKTGVSNFPITFSAADFIDHFSDVYGDNLTKIQICSFPIHGDLYLDDSKIILNQEILLTNLASLSFERNAVCDGQTSFSWKGFDGTNYSVEAALVMLTLDPSSSQILPYMGGTLGGALFLLGAGAGIVYYIKKCAKKTQAEIAIVPPQSIPLPKKAIELEPPKYFTISSHVGIGIFTPAVESTLQVPMGSKEVMQPKSTTYPSIGSFGVFTQARPTLEAPSDIGVFTQIKGETPYAPAYVEAPTQVAGSTYRALSSFGIFTQPGATSQAPTSIGSFPVDSGLCSIGLGDAVLKNHHVYRIVEQPQVDTPGAGAAVDAKDLQLSP